MDSSSSLTLRVSKLSSILAFMPFRFNLTLISVDKTHRNPAKTQPLWVRILRCNLLPCSCDLEYDCGLAAVAVLLHSSSDLTPRVRKTSLCHSIFHRTNFSHVNIDVISRLRPELCLQGFVLVKWVHI